MSVDELATTGTSKKRIAAFYFVLFAGLAVIVTLAFSAGEDREHEPPIAGGYTTDAPGDCLPAAFDIEQSGEFVSLEGEDTPASALDLNDGELTGDVTCTDGGEAEVQLAAEGDALTGTVDGEPFEAVRESDPPSPGTAKPLIPSDLEGEYGLTPESACLGGAVELSGSESVHIEGEGVEGTLDYAEGELSGTVTCKEGTEADVNGTAADRTIDLEITVGGPPASAPTEHVVAEKEREFPQTLAAFFIAVAVVMIVARLFGAAAARIGQPRVMGEVVAGIALGPTLLGAISPELQAAIFPTDIIPLIGVVANLGLIFYMFLVGLELDSRVLAGRLSQAFAISNASVALPMALGVAVAVPIYSMLAPDVDFIPFALFMGVAMSITAFPVLARILVERRMLQKPVGAIAMASAAIDDVTAWFLIALASAVAAAGSGIEVLETIGLALAFCLVMFALVRPLLSRVSTAYDEAGRVPGGWIAAIFAGVLFSAYATEQIGIALIFGAFVMGMVMPRHAGLTEDVTSRIEDFVVILLLPLFFAYTGLRTNVGLLDRPELWLITLLLIAVAITAKMAGAFTAARITGFGTRAAGVIGTLMNTRGLTELIVLNLALEKGVISAALFAALVLMALFTTFMAGPLLRLLDPKNTYGSPIDEDLDRAAMQSAAERGPELRPERAILVAPQSDATVAQLTSLAEPLANSEPVRELIVARLLRPPRSAAAGVRGGLQTENRLLQETTAQLDAARHEMTARGTAARSVAFISTQAEADLTRILEKEEVDLVLLDGRRPLLGGDIPRGDVGAMLEGAECDVAVLVAAGDREVAPGDGRPIVVPFGGAEHDWAALELGAWTAAATGAQLRLLGAAEDEKERARVTRLLADASLLVQQFAGVSAEPLIIEPGREAIVEASHAAGLLVIGLSERWREEGLGPARSEIARSAAAPILFVRRGTRTGALAPQDDVTRFTWSAVGR